VIASGIPDRLLHHATTVNIEGDSYRLREKRKAGLMKSTLSPHAEGGNSTGGEFETIALWGELDDRL